LHTNVCTEITFKIKKGSSHYFINIYSVIVCGETHKNGTQRNPAVIPWVTDKLNIPLCFIRRLASVFIFLYDQATYN